MVVSDLDQVYKLDQLSFGEDRSYFLKRRLELLPELSWVMMDGKRLTGFIFGRRGEGWASAGPWVMSEDAKNPEELLNSFALHTGDDQISIGILETNHQACDLVQSMGFAERMDSPWRMTFGKSNDLGASLSCLAVGSAAKG
jgi:hypothetical protein